MSEPFVILDDDYEDGQSATLRIEEDEDGELALCAWDGDSVTCYLDAANERRLFEWLKKRQEKKGC